MKVEKQQIYGIYRHSYIVLFKEAKFLIACYLAESFNECLKTGHFPDILKIAKIILLHKGGSKLELGKVYWPISIFSPINRVFEAILHRRIIAFWKKYDLFKNCQFKFRKKHSTNLAITYLHETILEERDADKSVCGMSLNFAKAFDCVNHEILLDERTLRRDIANSLFFHSCQIHCDILLTLKNNLFLNNFLLELECRKVACSGHFYS